MQAITTKFLGPTNTRGSRVVARCDAGRHTVSWDHALDIQGNHRAAAIALALKLGWNDMLRGGLATGYGYSPGPVGYVHVLVGDLSKSHNRAALFLGIATNADLAELTRADV